MLDDIGALMGGGGEDGTKSAFGSEFREYNRMRENAAQIQDIIADRLGMPVINEGYHSDKKGENDKTVNVDTNGASDSRVDVDNNGTNDSQVNDDEKGSNDEKGY